MGSFECFKARDISSSEFGVLELYSLKVKYDFKVWGTLQVFSEADKSSLENTVLLYTKSRAGLLVTTLREHR